MGNQPLNSTNMEKSK